MRKTSLLISAAAVLVGAATSQATLLAYEGFNSPTVLGGLGNATDGGTLADVDASGTGFVGSWTITNGAGGASTYQAAGLSYPGTYDGTNVAVGGHGRVTGAPGDNGFLGLNFSAATISGIEGATNVYFSFLGQNVAQSVTDAGVLDAATRTQFNLAAEYPRNSGVRLLHSGTASNSILGMIGNPGTWNAGGQSNYDQGHSNPEVVDTWGIGQFNDAHNIFTGNGGTQEADGGPNYDPGVDNYSQVDHIVVQVETGTSQYHMWVNPRNDGTSDSYITWTHTDGGDVVPFVWTAFGVEAGNDSSDRPVGDFVFDEIYIATTFQDASGLSVPEPSTYAAILGFLALAFVFVRRRRNK